MTQINSISCLILEQNLASGDENFCLCLLGILSSFLQCFYSNFDDEKLPLPLKVNYEFDHIRPKKDILITCKID